MVKLLHDGKAALVDFNTRVDAAFLDAHPGLTVIGSNTTGEDHLDRAECDRRGVEVITLRGETSFLESVTSTAEHSWGLVLALARSYKRTLHGEHHVGMKLAGKTLGIVGNGRIGKMVARMAEAFGMDVLVYDQLDIYKDRINLLRKSDFVSVHIPLEGNVDLFTEWTFRWMKPTAYFVNTSRDGIVKKGELRKALEHGVIAGAAVDFIGSADLVEYAKTHDNLILTDHCGGSTREDRALTENFILKKIDAHFV